MEISPLKENGSWWQCRTRLERRLSLCATVAVLVACGIAIVMAAMIYRDKDAQKGLTVLDMASAAALTEINNCELDDSFCNTPGCVIAAADLLDNMDKKVDPCEDFYSFACGGFEAKTVIPENKKGVDVKTLIRDEQIDQQMRFLMEKPIKEDEAEPFKLVKELYQSCVNPLLEELGMEPLKKILEQLGGWPVVEGDKWNETNFVWYETFYKLRQIGFYSSQLIEFTYKTDKKNPNSRILDLDQEMQRFSREDLTKGLENVAVKARVEYQIGLATLLGADEESARLQQTQALEFEILLAKIKLPYKDHRNAKELDNSMTIKELSAKTPGIPWLEYINTMLTPYHVLTEDEIVNVAVPDYFSKLIDLLAKTPKRTLANYLMSRVSFESSPYLNEAARKLRLKYEASLVETKENKPRWKECVDEVKHRLDLAVGAMYVREFIDEDARQLVKEMVEDIQNVFIATFDEADWIDNKTKKNIKTKATSMTAVVAYPDELLNVEKLLDDYENLTLGSNDFLKNSLNLKKSSANNYVKNLLVNKEKVRIRYIKLSPLDVMVNNIINRNIIRIPAAILQGAFFSKDRPTYLNYAAIGQLIGYTITLSFQEQGQKFDHEGNVGDWWEASTKEIYQERTKCIIDQYGNYTIPELGLNLDGVSTKGTNIGDNEGIKAAYRAYIKWASRKENNSENWDQVEQRLPGLSEYSARQLFWLQAARSLCEKLTPDELKSKMSASVFSPSRFRVQGAFANMPQFASDFNCPVGSVMNPVKKCSVW